jgi:hypothetical protein
MVRGLLEGISTEKKGRKKGILPKQMLIFQLNCY